MKLFVGSDRYKTDSDRVLTKLSIAAAGAIFVVLGTSGRAVATGATSFLNTSSGQVGTIDTSTGVFTPLANGPTFRDIALTETNQLFGITFTQLYEIDTNANNFSLIGNLNSASLNGLGFDNNGNLYGTGSNGFYQIDTSTGMASLVSNLSGFLSAGDIVFNPDTNEFLGTSRIPNSGTLFSIALDGTTTEIGNIGFSNVWGLFFENGDLFGYTADGQQILLDLATGAGTLDNNVTGISGNIFGAASLPSTSPTKTPEPTSTLGLLAMGAMGGVFWLKRKGQKKT